jgi:hypothetical protein
MSFNSVVEQLVGNLGMTVPDIALFVTALVGLMFFAEDLKTGLIAYLILFSIVYVVITQAGLESIRPLTAVLTVVVAMALSQYQSYAKRNIA